MKVSVCVPTVGRIGFLREALESVRKQEHREIEVLISENSGTEEYARQVSDLAGELSDIPIRLFHQARQLSIAANANFLIDEAHGDAVVHLPDDDVLCPHFLRRSVEVLVQNPLVDFTFGDHWLIDAHGDVMSHATEAATRHYGRDELTEGVLPEERLYFVALRQALCVQTMVIRKHVMQRFHFAVQSEPIPDFDLAVRMAEAPTPPRGFYIADRLIEYRHHGAQWSADRGKALASRESMAASLERMRNVPVIYEREWKEKLAGVHFSLAGMLALDGNHRATAVHAWRAFSSQPSFRHLLALAALPLLPAPVVRAAFALRARLSPRADHEGLTATGAG